LYVSFVRVCVDEWHLLAKARLYTWSKNFYANKF